MRRRQGGGFLAAAPFLAAAAWVAILFYAFHPGLMSTDTFVAFSQGLARSYDNWNPPLIGWSFATVYRLSGSLWPMLVLQLGALSMGLALLVGRSALRLALFLAMLVLPTLWAPGVTLWKDIMMAAVLLWAVICFARKNPLGALLLVGLAATLRHNAIFAIAPLVLLAASELVSTRNARLALAAALLVVMALLPRVVDRVTEVRDEWPLGQLFVWDLLGVYSKKPALLEHSIFAGEVTVDVLDELYSPTTVETVYYGRPGVKRLDLNTLGVRKWAVFSEWARVITAEPGIYLSNRARSFALLLNLVQPRSCQHFHSGIDPNRWGFALTESSVLTALLSARERVQGWLIFRGWLWGLLLAVELLIALARKDALVLGCSGSGLLYTVVYLFITPACDFRYLYWPVVAAMAALLLLLREDDLLDARPVLGMKVR